MKDRSDTEALAARLASTVSAIDSPGERLKALAKFISGYEPDAIGPVIGSTVADACSGIEAGITFLSILQRSAMEAEAADWSWKKLDDYFKKSKLDRSWKAFEALGPKEKEYVLAKVSLLTEVLYLLIEDDLLDPEQDMSCNGADVALFVLGSSRSGSQDFLMALSSYPVGIRKFMKEILAEMDFIEKSPGLWQYTLSRSSLDRFKAGGNLKAHLGTGQVSQAVALRNAENLIKRLELLIKALQMFPSGHPSIDPSAESLMGVLSRFRKESDQVTISVVGDTLMVNDIRVEARIGSISNFMRAFNERQMSSLTFEESVTVEDIKTFARLFNRPPAYIAEHGGMGQLAENRGLTSISVNRFHYQLVSGDGEDDSSLARGEVTVEDAIFSELIDRLERGDSIDSLPGRKIGDALKAVLAAARNDREEQRGMIARFVVALDPSLLEQGLLSNRSIQRGMAWKAVRKIIDRLLANLPSPDPDLRHESLGKLREMAQLAIERGKENSTIQIIESVSMLLKREQDPDVLYRGVVLLASVMEALLSRGMMSIALEAGKVLTNIQGMKYPRTELEAARKRSLAEARRKMDTIDAAEAIVQRILSEDEIVAREAGRLAMIAPPDNLVAQLVRVFNEDNRRLRSKAFQTLLRMGKRALNSIHMKLKETVTAFQPHMKDSAYSLPDSDWYTARNLVQILREIGSPESEGILADLCKVPDPRIRKECLLALVKVSQTTAESLAMFLINDNSKEVAQIALDIITKRASSSPAFIPKITDAFKKNPQIRNEIIESFSILGKHREVIEFLCELVAQGSNGILFSDRELISGTFRIFKRYGSMKELPVLENLRDEVEGGFFKKNKLDKDLLLQLKETIQTLHMSESVIEGDQFQDPGQKKKKTRKSDPGKDLHYQGGGDEEITILGPDFGVGD